MGHEEIDVCQNIHEDNFTMQDDIDSRSVNSNSMHLDSNNIHTHVEELVEINVENLTPTRERRNRSSPAYLNDYIVNLPSSLNQATLVTNQDSSMVHSIAHFISYENFTHFLRALLAEYKGKEGNICLG